MAAFRVASYIAPDPTPKRKALKNRDYLSFIHELPCCITGRYGVQAAHLSFAMPKYGHYGRGKQRKVSDRWALPLCPEEHQRQHSMSEEAYWRGRSPHVLALTLYGLWCDLGDEAVLFATAIINQHTDGKP